MEKSVKSSSEFSSPEASNGEELDADGDFFDIQNLPNEVILHIFKFLDLSSWKNGRLVCTDWDELLCFVAFFSRFSLVIKSDISKCCEVLCQTKSFFPLVKIDYCQPCSKMILVKILDKIGEGVTEISIDLYGGDLQLLDLPSNFLSKFSKARILTCSAFLFETVEIPNTLETINLFEVWNFMDRVVVEKLQKFNQETSKKIVVQSAIGTVDVPKETDLELIKVDEVAIKIAKSIGNGEIHLANDLEGDFEVDLSNVEKFEGEGYDDEFQFKKREDFDFYLNHIHQMPNLKVLNGLRTDTDECFFKHVPTVHHGIETFNSCEFFHCKECAEALQESFPNLKRFIGRLMDDFDFSTSLRLNVKFEEIDIQMDSYVLFEPLLQLPTEYFENLSNLAVLYIIRISDSPNWKEIFEKFPELPQLQRVHLWFTWEENPNFADFRGFFVKCPNIKKLDFDCFNDLNLTNLAELLKLLPKLEDLLLTNYHIGEDFNGKEFVDAIAPFAKNLNCLSLIGSNDEYVLGNNFKDDEMKYLKQKIPTLKEFSKIF